MEIRRVRLTDVEVAPLLAGLSDEYARLYGWTISVGEMSSAHPEQFDPPAGAFVVLVDEGETVAGGGLRPIGDGACEVKRMWTAPGSRRRGHASTVLKELEGLATGLGYGRIHVETGPAQPEACALYLSRGYREASPLETYQGALAFEKVLDRG